MTERNGRGALIVTMAIAFLLAFGGSRALADTSFNLTVPNLGGLSCCTGPYASVNIHLTDNTHATVTFDSLTSGGFIYLLAGDRAADLNVNAASFTATETSTNSLSGFMAPGPLSNTFGNNADGFGNFNLNVNSFDGFQHSQTEIVVTLTDNSGTWAS